MAVGLDWAAAADSGVVVPPFAADALFEYSSAYVFSIATHPLMVALMIGARAAPS